MLRIHSVRSRILLAGSGAVSTDTVRNASTHSSAQMYLVFFTVFFLSHTYTHTRLTALCPELPRCSRYQRGKTNLDFTEAKDSEWQWHQLGHMQVCTSLQTDNHASTPPLRFLQAGCPSCRPTNSVKTLSLSIILFAVRRLARGAQMRPVSTHVLTLRGLCVEHNRQPCRSG